MADRIPEYTFNTNNTNRISDLNFVSKASSIIKQSVKDELQSKLGQTAFSVSQLRSNLNRKPEITISDAQYTNNNRSILLAGSEKIVSLTFLPTTYINQFGIKTDTPRLDIHIAAVGVSMSNTIVKTELINETGTIKEIISQPDYSVAISGVLLGFFNSPTTNNPMAGKPIEDMKKLLQICESKIAVKVVSDTLNLYGITHLSIDSLNMPQELSDINIQRFTIQASSDDPELSIL
jgi:hypothetical protein